MRISKTNNTIFFLFFFFKESHQYLYTPTSEKKAQHIKLELLLTHNLWNSTGKILKSRLLALPTRYRKYWYESQLQGEDLLRELEECLCRWQHVSTLRKHLQFSTNDNTAKAHVPGRSL